MKCKKLHAWCSGHSHTGICLVYFFSLGCFWKSFSKLSVYLQSCIQPVWALIYFGWKQPFTKETSGPWRLTQHYWILAGGYLKIRHSSVTAITPKCPFSLAFGVMWCGQGNARQNKHQVLLHSITNCCCNQWSLFIPYTRTLCNAVYWIMCLTTHSFPWYWFHIQAAAKATSFVFWYAENGNGETEHWIVMPAWHLVSLILVIRMLKLKTDHIHSELSEFTFQLIAVPSGIMNLLHEKKRIFI